MKQTYSIILELEFDVTVKQTHPGHKGQYYGSPEKCFPAEAAEYEIESITYNGKPVNFLTDTQRKELEEIALEEAEEDDWQPEERSYEREYDHD